jgi:hypothetical protein
MLLAIGLFLATVVLLAACGASEQGGGDADEGVVDDDATPLDDDTHGDDDNNDNDTSPIDDDDDETTPDIEFFGSQCWEDLYWPWHSKSTVYHWRGTTVDQQTWPLSVLAAVWGAGPADVYAVGYANSTPELPYQSSWVHYDGEQWSASSRPGFWQAITAISGNSSNVVYQAVFGLAHDLRRSWAIYRYDGTAWGQEAHGGAPAEDAALYGIWAAATGEMYAVGDYQGGEIGAGC